MPTTAMATGKALTFYAVYFFASIWAWTWSFDKPAAMNITAKSSTLISSQ
jgi:hypothetical protein